MEINIKLSTQDIEKMLGRVYGFKEGYVKVSINGNGEIIATASEFPVQPAPTLYYGAGVRELSTDPTCNQLNRASTTVDPNVKVTLQNCMAVPDSNPENSMAPNDGYNPADAVMERHFGQFSKTNSRASKNIMK